MLEFMLVGHPVKTNNFNLQDLHFDSNDIKQTYKTKSTGVAINDKSSWKWLCRKLNPVLAYPIERESRV